jgi:Zn-dependent peptidase ImmA (M78 family)
VAVSSHDARELARRLRKQFGLGDERLGSLAEVCEGLGLYLRVVDRDADGASLLADGFGVCVIGGRAAPGRRRFTAAHELGHHALGDAYSTDVGVAASRDEREQLIDGFAAEFLLPESVLRTHWVERDEPRRKLVAIAGLYRVSWSVAVGTAHRLGLLDDSERGRLAAETPRRGDFLAVLGADPAEDLVVGEAGPAWRRAVLTGWQRGLFTAGRTVELLAGTLKPEDLPDRLGQPEP